MAPQSAESRAQGEQELPSHLLKGAWRIVEPVGYGELGEVFAVEESGPKKRAVIKLFFSRYLPEAWKNFEHVARAAGELPSGLFVRSFQFGFEPSVQRRYALSERVTQPSLMDLLQTQGRLDTKIVSDLLLRLASGLEMAHASGLVHRNLKPTNVFFDPNTRIAKVSDFGTAALQCSTPVYAGWAMSPGWATPEGIDPKQASAPSMDVYALGLLAFYALTGQSPYINYNLRSSDRRALAEELKRPLRSLDTRARECGCKFPPELTAWLTKSLALRPEDRYESVLDQAQAFQGLVSTVLRVSMPPSIIPPRVFDVTDRAVALVSAQPLALMPSFPPPRQELAPEPLQQESPKPKPPTPASKSSSENTQVNGNAQSPQGVGIRGPGLATIPPHAPRATPELDKAIAEVDDEVPVASSVTSHMGGPWKTRLIALVGALILMALGAILFLTWRGPA
ncbi:MAG: serine/threonine-protein kinase [Polyangiaceae bacterium]|nr:serine/threonine-protein kinase [Polyangiaceae bacterium]